MPTFNDETTELPRLGLGCMGMSGAYGRADEADGRATIHAALDAGINHLDTGDFYGHGHNELLIRSALEGHKREDVFIAVKFGGMRDPRGAFIGFDCRPAAVKNFVTYSLNRLGTDYIDLYQPARLDPAVPIEDTIGAIAELVQAGYVRHIGLSEMGAETIRRAHAVHPIRALQIEYSLMSRGIEKEILPVTRELGIVITAYGVLSKGLLSGEWHPGRAIAPDDYRAHLPRFAGENLERNTKLADALRALAEEKGATMSQIAIAWVLAQGPDMIPLIGAKTPARFQEALGALRIELSASDLRRMEEAVPAEAVAGDRYSAAMMRMLDSEK